jgi:uncharacterized protein
MDTVFYLCLVTFLAGLTQGFSGFGSVLLSLPLLALFLDIKTAIPLMALAGVPLTAFLLIPLWRHLEWQKVMPLLVGSAFGVPLGVYLLGTLDASMIMTALGIILLAYGLYGLLIRSVTYSLSRPWGYLFGLAAGCLGGGFSAGGPPVIVYTSLQPWSKDQIKATLQGYFFISGIMVVFFQAMGGYVTTAALHYFCISLLPLLLGTYLGHFFYGKISEAIYRKTMLLLLTFLGIFTVWRA